jgi:hypothetical protein
MPGCCADKSCNEKTCMSLPPGLTCAACVHVNRCTAMFGATLSSKTCDFFPRRFVAKPRASSTTPEKPEGSR